MCVAIHKPIGASFTKNELRQAWERNPDGGGFAYRTDEQSPIHICKGYFKKKAWVSDILELGKDVEVVAHARIATHGDISDENCHPFALCDNTGAWVHNGILSGYNATAKESDTNLFTQGYLDPLLQRYPDFAHTEIGLRVLDELLGTSKGIIMLHGLPVVIVNKSLGTLAHDGMWYSNTLFRTCGYTSSRGWTYNKKTGVSTWQQPRIGYQYPYDADDDGDYWNQWANEELEAGESTGETTVIDTPLSPEEQRLMDELTAAEKLALEEERGANPTVGIVESAETSVIALPGHVWINGKEYTWDDYCKLSVLRAGR